MSETDLFEEYKKQLSFHLPLRPIAKQVADEPGYSVWSPGSEFDRTRPKKILELLSIVRREQDPVLLRAFFAALIDATKSNLNPEDLMHKNGLVILQQLGIELPDEGDMDSFVFHTDPTNI